MISVNLLQRVCSICEVEIPITEFEKNPQKRFGYGYRCNPCNSSRRRDVYHGRIPSIRIERLCEHCGKNYLTINKKQRFCSMLCNNRSRKKSSLHIHLCAMINPKRRADGLTVDMLKNLWGLQEGKCALSGVELTHVTENGPVSTNVSIDRIDPGGNYDLGNIQLVCSAVNSFRRALSIEEFVYWCGLVVDHNGKSRGGKKSRRK